MISDSGTLLRVTTDDGLFYDYAVIPKGSDIGLKDLCTLRLYPPPQAEHFFVYGRIKRREEGRAVKSRAAEVTLFYSHNSQEA